MSDVTTVEQDTLIEQGVLGRVVYGRIAPNEDLVHGLEKICATNGLRHAFIRGALGSLVDACLQAADDSFQHIRGPAVEIVSMSGEVRTLDDGSVSAALTGVVTDKQGNVHGGPFVAGANSVCMTIEVTLEEWLPDTERGS